MATGSVFPPLCFACVITRHYPPIKSLSNNYLYVCRTLHFPCLARSHAINRELTSNIRLSTVSTPITLYRMLSLSNCSSDYERGVKKDEETKGIKKH